MSLHEALNLIANGRPDTIVAWAAQHVQDDHILKLLRRGYVTNWHDTAEYRGAVVYVFRRIAEQALDEIWKADGTPS